MPATDMELQILGQLAELQKSQNAMQVGLGQIHTSVEAVKEVVNGSAGRGPISERVLRLESEIRQISANGAQKSLPERVWKLEEAFTTFLERDAKREEEREKREEKREAEKQWFKRLIVGQVVQWLVTGGGIVYLLSQRGTP